MNADDVLSELIKRFIDDNKSDIESLIKREKLFIKTEHSLNILCSESEKIIELENNEIPFLVLKPYFGKEGIVFTNKAVYHKHDSEVAFRANYISIQEVSFDAKYNRMVLVTNTNRKTRIKTGKGDIFTEKFVDFFNNLLKEIKFGELKNQFGIQNQEEESYEYVYEVEKDKDKKDAKANFIPSLVFTVIFLYLGWTILAIFSGISFLSSIFLYFNAKKR